MDSRHGEGAHHCPGGTSINDCSGGVGAEHERNGARAGCVFRCKGAEGLREVPRQVARGNRNLSGPASAFAAKDNRSKRRDLPPYGGAASAGGATAASRSL